MESQGEILRIAGKETKELLGLTNYKRIGAGVIRIRRLTANLFLYAIAFPLPLHMTIDDLTDRLSALRLLHQTELEAVRARQRFEEAQLLTNSPIRASTVTSSPALPIATPLPSAAASSRSPTTDKYGTVLAIGDCVEIQTTGKSGRKGDIAIVVSFTENNSFVGIKVKRTRTITQRAPANLVFVRHARNHAN